jgi:hypothetical protein
MILFRESNGEPVETAPHLQIGAGGEARIYAMPDREELVAKVYHRPTEERARKLIQMLAEPPVDPTAGSGHASIAWPTDLLRDGEKSDRIVGYVMPRAAKSRPILDYYNPAARRVACPLFSYQYLLRTARNLAAVVAVLHARDYVVGDVNEANILVTATALVTVVDTDSFQVRDRTRQTVYRCPVARPEFTPVELQGQLLYEVDRTPDHDRFGLAVLLFLLLMEGTHPFAGIYTGEDDPPPYEARIAAGHFPYGTRPTPYRPLPLAPGIGLLPMQLQQLFRRCFQEGHDDPAARPDAQTWAQALRTAEENLETCNINPQHQYGRHLEECPWCLRTLRLGGRDPFPSRAFVETDQHLRPAMRVQAPLPTAAPPPPVVPVSPTVQAEGRGTGDLPMPTYSPTYSIIAGTADTPMRIVESKDTKAPPDVPPAPRVVHRSVQPRPSGGQRAGTVGSRRLPIAGVLIAVVLLIVVLVRAGLSAQPGTNAPARPSTGQPPVVQATQPVAQVNTASQDAATPQKLQQAILAGNASRVRALLAANPALAHTAGKKGWTPIHYAAYAGKADIASLLCAAGADANAKTDDGSTPLHLAAQEGHADATRTLLTNGADVNAQEKQGWTPLHFAAQEGHADVARLLIDGGADVNSREHAGLTPLAVAIREKMTDIANLLRQHGGQT